MYIRVEVGHIFVTTLSRVLKTMKLLVSCLFFIFITVASTAQDTGELRTIDGRKYKVHKVQAGETVYALSRAYEVTANDILEANPAAGQGLSIGQEILIPVREETGESVTHTVQAGETLFAISKKYDVDIEEIQKLNGMSDVALNVGQELVIRKGADSGSEVKTEAKEELDNKVVPEGADYTVEAGETLYAISRKFNVSVEDLVEWNKLEGSAISEGQKLRVSPPTAGTTQEKQEAVTEVVENKQDTPVKEEVVVKEEEPDIIIDTTPKTTDDFVEVTEKGVAELIPDTENTRKYLALHRNVRPGTIIRVRNEMNGREVWARVIGKLPETGDNKDILVKVSRAAFDRLGAVDKKFRVTITYIP